MMSRVEYRVYKKSKITTKVSLLLSVFNYSASPLCFCLSFVMPYPFIPLFIVFFLFGLIQERIERLVLKIAMRVSGNNVASFPVSEDEYLTALIILKLGYFHPTIKEIAKTSGTSRRKVIEHYKQVVRNYYCQKKNETNEEDVCVKHFFVK